MSKFTRIVTLFLHYLLLHVFIVSSESSNDRIGVANCPETELKRVDDQIKTCQDTAIDRFTVNPTEETLCKYLEEIVDDCTKGYAKCYEDRDIVHLRDTILHVEVDKLMRIRGIDDLVWQCPIVQNYMSRNEGRNVTFLATHSCDERAVSDAVEAFRYCVQGTEAVLVTRFSNSDSKLNTRKRIICDAILETVTRCYHALERCYNEEELGRMRRRQLDFLATFFYHAADKVGFSVMSCPVYEMEEQAIKGSINSFVTDAAVPMVGGMIWSIPLLLLLTH